MIRVLLADDHAVLCDGLRQLLEMDPGIKVVAAVNDGHEAISRAAELLPDVVVMDISMPKLGGIEATRAIVGRAGTIGVVVLSMHSAEDTIRLALEAGARGFLLKESAGAEVGNAVRAVAAGGCYLGEGIALDKLESRRPGGLLNGKLTASERRVLRLVVEGKSNAEAAGILGLSVRTVETYRGRLMQKLQIDDVAGLVKFAIRHGLTTLD